MDEEISKEIMRMTSKRGSSKTVCPSEVARSLFSKDEWREEMEHVRKVARKLCREGKIEITQHI